KRWWVHGEGIDPVLCRATAIGKWIGISYRSTAGSGSGNHRGPWGQDRTTVIGNRRHHWRGHIGDAIHRGCSGSRHRKGWWVHGEGIDPVLCRATAIGKWIAVGNRSTAGSGSGNHRSARGQDRTTVIGNRRHHWRGHISDAIHRGCSGSRYCEGWWVHGEGRNAFLC